MISGVHVSHSKVGVLIINETCRTLVEGALEVLTAGRASLSRLMYDTAVEEDSQEWRAAQRPGRGGPNGRQMSRVSNSSTLQGA